MVEFGKVEDMRFQQNGRRGVQFAADIEQVLQKVRIGEFFLIIFVNELPLDLSVFHDFCPDFEHNADGRERRSFRKYSA